MTIHSELVLFICLAFIVGIILVASGNTSVNLSSDMFNGLKAKIFDRGILSSNQRVCDFYIDSVGSYPVGYAGLELINLESPKSSFSISDKMGTSSLNQNPFRLIDINLNVCKMSLNHQVNNIIMGTNNMSSIIEKIKYRLDANETYPKDEPIVIKFTLENNSEENLWILNWNTPLEGLKNRILNVICDGKEIPYEGIMMKRGQPSKEDYVQITPGSSISASVDLLEGYAIPLANQCKVDFKGRILDISTNDESIPKKVEDFELLPKITGNATTFRVSPL